MNKTVGFFLIFSIFLSILVFLFCSSLKKAKTNCQEEKKVKVSKENVDHHYCQKAKKDDIPLKKGFYYYLKIIGGGF